MRILMVASEAAPFAKTGGLADVLGSLPAALAASGDETAVFLPRYGFIEVRGMRRVFDSLPVHLNGARFDCSVYLAPERVPYYLLDCPPLFDRKSLYGEAGMDYPDNYLRFAVFCRAALSVARITGKPVKFLGTGEKLDGLEPFDPSRIAARILGMGDVLGLIEQVQAKTDAAAAQKLVEKVVKGRFPAPSAFPGRSCGSPPR